MGLLFQCLYRKASPEYPGRQPPVGSMEKQFFTGSQRLPYRILSGQKIFAEPPVRPLGQGFLSGRNGRRKLGASANTEADGGFSLGGIGGSHRELVQQAHRPAVTVRLDEKGA